jgi:hypothetical protein
MIDNLVPERKNMFKLEPGTALFTFTMVCMTV